MSDNANRLRQHLDFLAPNFRVIKRAFPTPIVNRLRLKSAHRKIFDDLDGVLINLTKHLDAQFYELVEIFNDPNDEQHAWNYNNVYGGIREGDVASAEEIRVAYNRLPNPGPRDTYRTIQEMDFESKDALGKWLVVAARFRDILQTFTGASARFEMGQIRPHLEKLDRCIDSLQAALL